MSPIISQSANTAIRDPVEKRTKRVRIPTNPDEIRRVASRDGMSYY
jgi:hypothetical protein